LGWRCKKYTQTLNIKDFFYTTQRFSQVLLSWNLFSSLHPTGWLSSKQSWQASVSTPATHTNQPTTSPTPLHPQTAQTIHSSPSPSPKQFPFSSSISKPITKNHPISRTTTSAHGLLHTAVPLTRNFVARRSGGLPLTYEWGQLSHGCADSLAYEVWVAACGTSGRVWLGGAMGGVQGWGLGISETNQWARWLGWPDGGWFFWGDH
jgi:hypothetical protein